MLTQSKFLLTRDNYLVIYGKWLNQETVICWEKSEQIGCKQKMDVWIIIVHSVRLQP